MLYSGFSSVIYSTHSGVRCQPLCLNSFHPSLSPGGVQTFVFYFCVCFCFANRFICTIFSPRFHIYALIYNICFSLPDLIWTACGPWWRHLSTLSARAVLRTSSGSGTLTQHLQNGNTENADSLALLAKQGRIQGHLQPPGCAQESAAVQRGCEVRNGRSMEMMKDKENAKHFSLLINRINMEGDTCRQRKSKAPASPHSAVSASLIRL